MNEKAEQWAVVDLFGHQRIAGRISEHAIGGCSFVRIDVPEIMAADRRASIPAHTRLFGSGAIYGIAFTDEATACLTAASLCVKPLDSYTMTDAIRNASEERLKQYGLARLPAPDQDHDDSDIPY